MQNWAPSIVTPLWRWRRQPHTPRLERWYFLSADTFSASGDWWTSCKKKKPIKKPKAIKKNKTKQYTFCHFLHFFAGRFVSSAKALFLLPKPLNQLICPSWHLLIIDISKLRCCNRRPCKPFTSEWLELAIKVCCSPHVRAIRFTIRTHKIFRKVLSESKRLNFFIYFRSLILVTIHAERNWKLYNTKLETTLDSWNWKNNTKTRKPLKNNAHKHWLIYLRIMTCN